MALVIGDLKAIDLFAGPGGWDVAAAELGLNPLGIEYDEAACATRKAAGHRTLQADVAVLDPQDFAPCDLLIASPPCQAWSMAGKRGGEKDIERVYALTDSVARGDSIRTVLSDPTIEWEDDRSQLVVAPLGWALELRPRFIAFEQVPPVLDYWKHVAEILRGEGYSAWAGILSAEQYGVPQTRKRAILMASLDGPVHPPAPTHQRYVPGEPAREEHTLEGTILPWVSMAEALGWAQGDRVWADPSRPNTAVRHQDEPAPTVFIAKNDRRWQVGFPRRDDTGTSEDGSDWRGVDVPAPTVTGGGSDTGGPEVFGRGGRERIKRTLVNNAQENAAKRSEDEPAPTITAAHDSGERRWVEDGRGDPLALKGEDWHERRPATTIAGDARVFQPGGHHGEGEQSQNAVRVTTQEAAILQGFSPDYPWQGSRTKQFQQIGNAVPPPLARAVLEALVGSQELAKVA